MSKKTLERPLNSKEIKPVNPKGNQSWLFIEGLMLKLKLQSSGHLMRRNDSLEKTLLLGKIEGRRRRGWQRMKWLASQLSGHEFEQAWRVGDGQGGLVYCSPWTRKESDTTEQLNWISFFKGDFNKVTKDPVVRTLHFHCQGPGFNPCSGNQNPASCMKWPKKKNVFKLFLVQCAIYWELAW